MKRAKRMENDIESLKKGDKVTITGIEYSKRGRMLIDGKTLKGRKLKPHRPIVYTVIEVI